MTGGFQLYARFLFCRALPVTRDSGANPKKWSGNQGMPSLTLDAAIPAFALSVTRTRSSEERVLSTATFAERFDASFQSGKPSLFRTFDGYDVEA